LKKTYQIQKQRSVQKLRKHAEEENPPVQLAFPLAEIIALLKEGLTHLVRQVGIALLNEVMEVEVKHLVGERHRADPNRSCSRWGSEPGCSVVAGQKVPLRRPRVRDRKNREVPLGSYELFQRSSLMEESVWNKMMHGLTTRRYSEVVKEFVESYGIEKSTISRHFIQASRRELQKLSQRKLKDRKLCAILIDGTCFNDQQLIVALGVQWSGQKLVLGLRQGATENATVVKQMLADMQERGVDFEVPRLYVLDGSKALHAAVRQHAGLAALVQRCQIHKIRNVTEHLSNEYSPYVKTKMQAAYSMFDHSDAKRALQSLHRELMQLNPSAARSLEEGMEETVTVHRLRVPAHLRQSLASTNMIESAFSTVEMVCRNVKRWQGGDQYLRWVGSALLYAESRWNRLRGHRQIPVLIKELEVAVVRTITPRKQWGVG
jgi:transposase-like protein